MAFRVFHSPEEFAAAFPAERSVLTVGNFDGLHRGHQAILSRVVARAREHSAMPVVVTFDPHPMTVLRPGNGPAQLQTLDQRLAGFDQIGLAAAVVVRFDLSISRMSPEEFVRWAVAVNLRARDILVGANFRFGHKQAGDVHLLGELGRRFDFTVEIVPPVIDVGEVISSTTIRRWLQEGDVERAAALLGRAFVLTGQIVPGTGTGRRLLFPTLNLRPEQGVLPALGVYATESLLENRAYLSATNVGVRPTFGDNTPTVETHLLEFSEDRRSGSMEVRFWKRLRDEMKFNGPDDLRAQIQRDLAATRSFFRHLRRM
jgi:riboflavin kinase/FMN adenylyltransferase